MLRFLSNGNTLHPEYLQVKRCLALDWCHVCVDSSTDTLHRDSSLEITSVPNECRQDMREVKKHFLTKIKVEITISNDQLTPRGYHTSSTSLSPVNIEVLTDEDFASYVGPVACAGVEPVQQKLMFSLPSRELVSDLIDKATCLFVYVSPLIVFLLHRSARHTTARLVECVSGIASDQKKL